MSVLTSKPKYNICDMVDFCLKLNYKDCDGKTGVIKQKATGEVIGMFCDVQCVSNGRNNWQYYIARAGMRHARAEYEISLNAGSHRQESP